MPPVLHSHRLRASLALLFASSSLILAGCNDSQSAVNTAPKDPEVGVVTLALQSTTLKSELAGRTAAQMVAQIRPQVGGIVQKRAFTEGAMVKAGDLLYQIDPASYQSAQASAKASLARAEATAAAARLKAKRQADLFAIEAISQQDNEDAQTALQQAEADVASARAALETATINLERTRIVSPIAGRAETSTVTPGALVTANQETALTTVQQLDPIYVDIPQSSLEVLQLRKALASGSLKSEGDAARIQLVLEDGSTYAHEGKLQFAGVTVNTTTGAVTLRALVPNPEHLLMPGMYVRARLDKGTDPEALLVPQPAIGRDNTGKATALVVTPENKVEQRKVEVAEAIGTNWRVTDGLKAGERVVVEGSSKVRPGQSVRVVDVPVVTGATPSDGAQTKVSAAATTVAANDRGS
ncbi:efflux RND transporter periplasmic adaptor subunit [Propionivibrio sp.]|uniref:efflux RND transporter periplasmic adaptor subunit n=1 Tax=Propionivibrio sp. TaxID=2212460 RepID=UPI0025DDC5A5|nr:efflux RND transporter periplasmic adaptor subunit [Propionivibrio sp.]